MKTGDRMMLPVHVVSVEPHDDGTQTVKFKTDEPKGSTPQEFTIRTTWHERPGTPRFGAGRRSGR